MLNLQTVKKIGSRLDKVLGALAVISVFCLIFITSHLAIFDLDIWLHLKSGQMIWQNRSVPQQDLFSFTLPAHPWIDHEPLFQLLSYIIYNAGQSEWLILFACYVIFFSFFILFLIARKKIRSYFEIALLLFIAATASASRFNIRPDIFSVLFFALFIYILRFYSHKNVLWLLIPLQILWVNFHGYFFLGPMLIMIFIIGEFLRKNLPVLPWDWKEEAAVSAKTYERLQAVLILSLIASLINPNGLNGALYPVSVVRGIFSGESKAFFDYIQELRPSFGARGYSWNCFYALVALCFTLLLINFKKLKIVDVLLALVFVVFAIAQRNIVFFVFSAVVVIAIYSLPAWEFLKEKFKFKDIKKGAFYYLVRNALAILFIVWIWGKVDNIAIETYYDFETNRYVSLHSGINEKHYPKKAVEFLLANDLKAPIFNDFNSGAYLVGNAFPQRKVFIDGRTEFYGHEFFSLYLDAMRKGGDAFKKAQERYDLKGAILTDTSTDFPYLVKTLYSDPQWKLVFLDESAAVFLKQDKATKDLIARTKIDLSKYTAPKPDLKAIGIRRVYPWPYIKRSSFFELIGEDAAAGSEAQEALNIMPNCAEAFQILGRISLRKGSLQEAFINLRKAAVLMPKNSGILTDLGEALIKSKDYASAEKALIAVNKLNKKYAPAYYQLSLLCIDTGRIPEAKKALQKAKFYSRDDFELSLKIEQREAELNK